MKRGIWLLGFLLAAGSLWAAAATAPVAEDLDQLAAQVLRETNERVNRLKLAGRICLELGRLDEARQYLKQAAAISPDEEDLSEKLADLCRLKGDYVELVRIEERRAAVFNNPADRAKLAEALVLAGKPQEAERLWMVILAEGLWSESAVQRVIVSARTVGRADYAERVLRGCCPSWPSALTLNYAEVLAARGRFPEAAAVLDDFLRFETRENVLVSVRRQWAWDVFRAGAAEKAAAALDAELSARIERLKESYLSELASQRPGLESGLVRQRLERLAGDDPRVHAILEKSAAVK